MRGLPGALVAGFVLYLLAVSVTGYLDFGGYRSVLSESRMPLRDAAERHVQSPWHRVHSATGRWAVPLALGLAVPGTLGLMNAWKRMRRRTRAVCAVLTVSTAALVLAALASFTGYFLSAGTIAESPMPKATQVRFLAVHAFAVPILFLPVLGGLGWLYGRLYRRASSPTDRG